jgi:hypothetical protein
MLVLLYEFSDLHDGTRLQEISWLCVLDMVKLAALREIVPQVALSGDVKV